MEFAKYISDFVFITGYDEQMKTVVTAVFPVVDNARMRVKELMQMYPTVQRVSQYSASSNVHAEAEYHREVVLQGH